MARLRDEVQAAIEAEQRAREEHLRTKHVTKALQLQLAAAIKTAESLANSRKYARSSAEKGDQ
jgi:hypothetical protein